MPLLERIKSSQPAPIDPPKTSTSNHLASVVHQLGAQWTELQQGGLSTHTAAPSTNTSHTKKLLGKIKSHTRTLGARLHHTTSNLSRNTHHASTETLSLQSALQLAATFSTAYYTGQLLGHALSAHEHPPLLNAATYAAVGAVRGFAASLVGSGGNLRKGVQGAASGALFGGIQGQYGDQWTTGRVVQHTLAGAISSGLHDGNLTKGFKTSLITSALTYIAALTRAYECANSSRVPRQLGVSPGVLGTPGKIAGERINAQQFAALNQNRSITESLHMGRFEDDLNNYLTRRYKGVDSNPSEQEVFGLFQGDPGQLFGHTYPPGGFIDRVVESFAGIHDFLNHPWFYNPDGTSHYFLNMNNALTNRLGTLINVANIAIALPVGLSALVPTYMYPYLARRQNGTNV